MRSQDSGEMAARQDAAALIRRIQSLLLAPGEGSSASLPDFIADVLGMVPSEGDAGHPYLGSAVPDMSWLDPYEAIPDAGLDPRATVGTALGALGGQIRWESPGAVHNVNQPVLLPAWAAHAVTSLYNPNALWDLVSGGCLDMERQVTRQLSGLMGWDARECDGLFTFGGKAGLIYAIRLGLNRCVPELSRLGLGGARPMVITTGQNHYAVDSACSLLGTGTGAVVKVATDRRGAMDADALEQAVRAGLSAGRQLACVVLCGGNTLDAVIDPVRVASEVLDELDVIRRFGYRPWLHFDLPLGWPWLFFRGYDFAANPLGIGSEGLGAAESIAERLADAGLADSTCFDFHKLGFSPYPGSVFLTRHWRELRSVFRDERPSAPWLDYGENFRQHHSIEHSRSAAPIVAAWVVLQVLGRDGFRAYLGQMHQATARLRSRLAAGGMTVLNADSPSLATMILPARPAREAAAGQPSSDAAGQDRYTEALFRYIAGLDGQADQPVAIGFVPGYARPGSDAAPSALRLFTVNPWLDEQQADVIADRVISMKKEFDLAWGQHDAAAPRLLHTPR
ncbi:MAG: pyridoxal phosphate-dependent decarboxylase family protein [Streptosporangiaceae bacterium]